MRCELSKDQFIFLSRTTRSARWSNCRNPQIYDQNIAQSSCYCGLLSLVSTDILLYLSQTSGFALSTLIDFTISRLLIKLSKKISESELEKSAALAQRLTFNFIWFESRSDVADVLQGKNSMVFYSIPRFAESPQSIFVFQGFR